MKQILRASVWAFNHRYPSNKASQYPPRTNFGSTQFKLGANTGLQIQQLAELQNSDWFWPSDPAAGRTLKFWLILVFISSSWQTLKFWLILAFRSSSWQNFKVLIDSQRVFWLSTERYRAGYIIGRYSVTLVSALRADSPATKYLVHIH